MSKKIIELFKTRAAKGDIGIEIEVEGRNLKAIDNEVWKSEDDGSLRGNFPDSRCEYILRTPVKIDAVLTAVSGLRAELEVNNALFAFSYRTSVHVHLNVQQLLYHELLSMMYAYYLLEEPLMTFCGKTRKGNNFCLRLADAEGVLDWVTQMFEFGPDSLLNVPGDNARYAAMNIEAIRKYGSVEFRGMQGNMDAGKIDKWCSILVSIREYAKKKKPKDVYEDFMKNGPAGFAELVLGKDVDVIKYARMEKDMEVSFSISIDLPFSYKEIQEIIDKNYWEYEVGELVKYEQALEIQRNGGNVEGTEVPRMYRVARKAVKFVPVEEFDFAVEVPAGIIVDDAVRNHIERELLERAIAPRPWGARAPRLRNPR